MFIGAVEGKRERFRYRLRIEPHQGEAYEMEDAYRFGPVLGELDIHLLVEGTHLRAFEKLGSHVATIDGVDGASFAVWAPNAKRVSVVGDFNGWDGRCHPMRVRLECGVWEIFIPGAKVGSPYKYEIKDRFGNLLAEKADPFAIESEQPPKTASLVPDPAPYEWNDQEWMARRHHQHDRDAPISIYEVHLGSWRRKPEEGDRYLTYHELADELVPYAKDLGFTHIELMPIHEFPFDGSWGYQPVGMFAPTSRFGKPNDFRHLIDRCHQAGLGLLIDWVAGHFPSDAHGLVYFDGTHLYEHSDPRKGKHMDWDTLIYNYGRREVSNFLLSNALYWMEEYHVDGLRVDAVASMLYLDYSRKEGEWIPNMFGGRENLEAIDFIKRMNELVYGHHEGVMTIAEEFDLVADGFAADVSGRARLRLQVEHGVDERYPSLHDEGADPPALSSRPSHLRPAVRLHRELHPAAVARRGRPRQGLAPVEDAGGSVAAVREPALLLHLHVHHVG